MKYNTPFEKREKNENKKTIRVLNSEFIWTHRAITRLISNDLAFTVVQLL